MMRRALYSAALLLATAPAIAQSQPPLAAEAPPSDRLEAAKKLIDVMLPPSQRQVMIEQIALATMKSTLAGVRNSSMLEQMLKDPKAKPAFERMFERVQQDSLDQLKASFPGMIVAMERAYARRFTIAQMAEMHAFFATPTGQLYIAQSASIMSDPDVSAWQEKSITDSMNSVPKHLEALGAELEALTNKEKSGDQ